MDATWLIAGLVLALIIAGLYAFSRSRQQQAAPPHKTPGAKVQYEQEEESDAMTSRSSDKRSFVIRFPMGNIAYAMRLPREASPLHVIKEFSLSQPRPTIFISGGASAMTEEDIERTRTIVADGIAVFAQRHNITVVDGGTEAGVMKMIGDARFNMNYTFPLIGVCPFGRISYPGHDNGDSDAPLEDGHSHFVLVDGNEWGDESHMIVSLTRAIAAGSAPMIGILINGGKIAERDVYLATAQGPNRIPMLVLDGSGRKANEIATAKATGHTDSITVKAIVSGGDIRITRLDEGADAMYQQLQAHFFGQS